MKKLILIMALMIGTVGTTQNIDTTQADSIQCLDKRIVLHIGAAAVIIFYAEHNQGNPNFLQTILGIHRRNKSNYHE